MALITSANAREMGAKGLEGKRLAAIQRANGDLPKPLLPDDKFRLLTLSRVRTQMERIFAMMSQEDDPAKLDRLASALDRLAGRERELANRSLPPSQKPIGTKDTRRALEPTSEPRPACASDTPTGSVLVPVPDPTTPQAQ